MRSGAILPFTSALGGVCAAGGAAAVEFLPYVEEMHIAPLEVLVAGFFPALGAFFASSASVTQIQKRTRTMAQALGLGCRACLPTSLCFDPPATHARILLPAALASVSYG